MQFAIARYAFQGGPEQLSLTPGEKLHVETVTDDGWVLGTRFQGTERLDGERGYFPLSYVEMQNDPESKSQASDSPDNAHAVHWTPMVTIDNFQGEPDAHGLSVVKNERVLALEQSEGGNAGWTFCKNSAGDKGYVPAVLLLYPNILRCPSPCELSLRVSTARGSSLANRKSLGDSKNKKEEECAAACVEDYVVCTVSKMLLSSPMRGGLNLPKRAAAALVTARRGLASEAYVDEEARSKICKELGVSEDSVLLTIAEMRRWRSARAHFRTSEGEGEQIDPSIGFVPTMGALHDGHMSLIAESTKQCNFTAASIFVNPAQFAPHEDFGKYPRQPVKDLALLFEKGADAVFVPSQQEMYPGSKPGQTSTQVTKTHVVPDGIDFVSEGAARPGFFRGVATVVSKLLNIVQPTHLFLGQKDGLQQIVVRRMVRDLNIDVQVVPVETMREQDGLAMSSRNVYLSEEQRRAAPALYKALCAMRDAYNDGERDFTFLKLKGQEILDDEDLFLTEYLSLCDNLEGAEFTSDRPLPEENIMASAAVSFGNCRILDNVLLGKQPHIQR
ncbi:Pantoate--beta-alanine ligase [Hondaea fermentalgiana]|uniref:Pantoate--beta-alanine ligase n=1 Tax=Hondaea fermentalgiana TaxID=2315210 RepID=A0A2R5G835_9STRA|nr:Pantoate--beta-alanine ligase [Hondaea fermentalgiana]|eukprot:GBG27150.1 Pantoate--beta-alanine ligase [Hondaea fermentalgiana]